MAGKAAYHTAAVEKQAFSKEDLTIIIEILHNRVALARGPMAVYFDVTGEFRASPAHGTRFKRALLDFPDCIIGTYTPKIPFSDLREDVLWFTKTMGLEDEETS